MTHAFSRTDTSVLAGWAKTVDRWMILILWVIIVLGCLLVATASPPVAERVGLPPEHFVTKQLMMLVPALALAFAVSLLSPRGVRRLATIGLLVALAALVLTPLLGDEIKGARRWLRVAGVSIQASEFAKPLFAIVAGWLLSLRYQPQPVPGTVMALGLYGLMVALLLAQPDLGQTMVLTALFGVQLILAGLPAILIAIGLVAMGAGFVGAYLMFPHVASRVDRFLNPDVGDNYQVDRALEAFVNGGLYGTGPFQGKVKAQIPDGHADFIFAVAGEELGLGATLAIVALFLLLVLRALQRVRSEENLFVLFATTGLVSQIGLQAIVHMGSSLQLLPAKGMTLPFISYGGSSLLALGLCIGFLIALTRSRPRPSLPVLGSVVVTRAGSSLSPILQEAQP